MLLISFWFLLITPAQRSLQLGASILKFVTFPFDYIHFIQAKPDLLNCLSNMNIVQQSIILQVSKVFILLQASWS
jgi:hypothetical protein